MRNAVIITSNIVSSALTQRKAAIAGGVFHQAEIEMARWPLYTEV